MPWLVDDELPTKETHSIRKLLFIYFTILDFYLSTIKINEEKKQQQQQRTIEFMIEYEIEQPENLFTYGRINEIFTLQAAYIDHFQFFMF